jgi:hypothetical protein
MKVHRVWNVHVVREGELDGVSDAAVDDRPWDVTFERPRGDDRVVGNADRRLTRVPVQLQAAARAQRRERGIVAVERDVRTNRRARRRRVPATALVEDGGVEPTVRVVGLLATGRGARLPRCRARAVGTGRRRTLRAGRQCRTNSRNREESADARARNARRVGSSCRSMRSESNGAVGSVICAGGSGRDASCVANTASGSTRCAGSAAEFTVPDVRSGAPLAPRFSPRSVVQARRRRRPPP